ncbi:MAG: pyrimidine 5'-nucleotidase [Paracoccaceae bacterium]
MIAARFSHVRHWVFDLDNTLYPPEVRLFDQIEQRMTDWVMNALDVDRAHANTLRKEYWHKFGTTLAGLMAEHRIDADAYLEDVHDISFDALTPDGELRDLISALPGRKIVYTNGSRPYAENVLRSRGLSDAFDAVYGVEHAGFRPKPERIAFETVFGTDGIHPGTGAMFEDDARNLAAPFAMGMRTVHVAPEPQPEDHIEHHTDDLSDFLKQVLA